MYSGKETRGRRQRIITVIADLAKDAISREGKCYAGNVTKDTQKYDRKRYDTVNDQDDNQIEMVNNHIVIYNHRYIL